MPDEMELVVLQRGEDADSSILMTPGSMNTPLARRDSFIAETARYRTIVAQQNKVFNRDMQWLSYWDMAVLILTLWSAFYTPFEIAFIEQLSMPLTVLNIVIDFCFLGDMSLQFFICYFDPVKSVWVYHRGAIAAQYVRGWFGLDLLSTIPWDLIGLLANSDSVLFRRFRIFKLLRLLKILRLLRVSRVVKQIETSFGLPYATMRLATFFFVAAAIAHWMACLIALAPLFEGTFTGSWLESYGVLDEPIATKYVSSLYWAIMTITTIGYGDVPLSSTAERLVAVTGMIVGGATYAYVVGNICGTVAGLDMASRDLRQATDHLNDYLEDMEVPFGLRKSLRQYFLQSRGRFQVAYYQQVVGWMSPGLQGKFNAHCHSSWFKEIGFFNAPGEEGFIFQIVRLISIESFPAEETVIREGDLANSMYVVKAGLVAIQGKVLRSGQIFGTDFILTNAQRDYSCVALMTTDLYAITKESLETVLEGDFPKTAGLIRKAAIRMAFGRAIRRYANAVKRSPPMKVVQGNGVLPADVRTLNAHVVRLDAFSFRLMYRFTDDESIPKKRVRVKLTQSVRQQQICPLPPTLTVPIDLGEARLLKPVNLSLPAHGVFCDLLQLWCEGRLLAQAAYKESRADGDEGTGGADAVDWDKAAIVTCTECSVMLPAAQMEREQQDQLEQQRQLLLTEEEALHKEIDDMLRQLVSKVGAGGAA